MSCMWSVELQPPSSPPLLNLSLRQDLVPPAAMEIEISSTTVLHPSPSLSSTNDHHLLPLSLSHLDTDRNLDVPFRTLRLYPPPPPSTTTDPITTIISAISSSLSLYYPLTFTLHRRHLLPSSTGVPLTLAASSLTLSSLLSDHLPGSPLLDNLAPHLPEDGRPVAFQLTRLACGGVALGMCVHHALCDGAGATLFLSATLNPVWDRPELLGPRVPPRVVTPFHDILGLGHVSPYDTPAVATLARHCFRVSNACVDRFRAGLAMSSGTNFTTFEVLAAFIWAAKVRATGEATTTTVKLVYSMNISKILDPPLPEGYWGNVCVPVYIQLSSKELTCQPTWKIAEMMRRSKRGVTEEYVRSYVDFQEMYYGEGITAGGGVTAFTDWRRLGHSAVDFGWGGPVAVWPMSWKLMGSVEPCFLLPCVEREGREVEEEGFMVVVTLPENAVEGFRSEMEIFSSQRMSERM